jgi:hypothetical protein
MELTGGADCGALGGDEKSERVEEEVASGGSVRVERWVRPLGHCINMVSKASYGKSRTKVWRSIGVRQADTSRNRNSRRRDPCFDMP